MVRILVLLLVLAALVALGLRAEPLAPTVSLEKPVETVGRATPVRLVVRDRGTGVARVEVRLVPASGTPVTLFESSFPRRSWLGSGVHETVVTPTLDAATARVPEGAATLEVLAADHSWWGRFRKAPRLAQPVTVDLTAPSVEVIPGERVARLGGSECVVYRVGPDTVRSTVEIAGRAFPGVPGLFADGALRAALFPIPQDAPDGRASVVVIDAAGNERRAPVSMTITPRRFADKTMPLSDDFLSRKVPELLAANDLPTDGDLVTGYLRINRDLRVATEERLRGVCRESTPAPRWEGAFLRLPNAAPLSGFADRRTYVYAGKTVDQQTHLGFDLASLRGSPVPAANNGRVVLAGPLGIYGNTVVLDHGFGLFSLYGHLSTIAVGTGADVARGDTVGNTGETGLAGGDHLHFSVMIHGIHVDPVEWWDAHWIRDHVDLRLNEFPRAGSAS